MKNLLFLFILFMIISCTANKNVYWCGDHPCINKKEKEAFFKKTMIVEIKDLKNKNYKDDSEINKIIQQAQLNKKKIIKNEKKLSKQARLEEKKRIKNEKKSSKKKILVNQKKQLKKSVKLDAGTENIKIEPSKFSEYVKKITKKNSLKPYPDINDTPN